MHRPERNRQPTLDRRAWWNRLQFLLQMNTLKCGSARIPADEVNGTPPFRGSFASQATLPRSLLPLDALNDEV
jgi:hypothetical protein